MAAFPKSSYRYKNTTNNRYKISRVKFPDPVEEAQVMFRTKPEEMLTTQAAKEDLLQSVSDYKNMMSGVDMSNQNLFKSVNNTLVSGIQGIQGTQDKLIKNTSSDMSSLKHFLESPDVMKLIDHAKLAIDNRIDDATLPLQRQLDSAIGRPVQVPMEIIKEKFKDADLKELPLFEISMDPADPEKGIMGVFKELECQSYFELLPRYKNYKSSLCAVNEKGESKMYPLTEEFCTLVTENTLTDNKILMGEYLDLYTHTVKDKVDDVFAQFKSGLLPGFTKQSQDEYAIQDNKKTAAKQITEWANKSIKFRDWIANLEPDDIVSNAAVFLAKSDDDSSDSSDSGDDGKKGKLVTAPNSTRMSLRSDARRNEELEQKVFKTPKPETSKQKLSSNDSSTEGKQLNALKPSNVIIIPPSKIARLDRVKVILGALEADSSADYLAEFSAIVESLFNDKMINKGQHAFLMNKYSELTKIIS